MHKKYTGPASVLLRDDELEKNKYDLDQNGWIDYPAEFGIGKADIPFLIEILKDESLIGENHVDQVVWPPVHAWRALGQLKATEAIADLISLLDEEEDDWAYEEVPLVLGMIGPDAIEPLARILENRTKHLWLVHAAAESLVCVQENWPDTRSLCVSPIFNRIKEFSSNDVTLNALLISCLVNLKAIEHLELIRQAFQENAVDISFQGDIEDVEIGLGVRESRSTPKPNYLQDYLVHRDINLDEKNNELHSINRHLPTTQPKIGRNDPCRCGSGKKYKKCCLMAEG